MVRVASHGALEALRPDHDALAHLGGRDGWIGVSAYVLPEAADGRLRVYVRHFAPLVGVPEDPVTGSAAGALGACLAAAGSVPPATWRWWCARGVLGRPRRGGGAGGVGGRDAAAGPRRGRVVPSWRDGYLRRSPPAAPGGGR